MSASIFTPKEQTILRNLRAAREAVKDKANALDLARRRLIKVESAYKRAFQVRP